MSWESLDIATEFMSLNKPDKLKGLGAGEMAQGPRALAALVEDPGSVPNTHMVAYSPL